MRGINATGPTALEERLKSAVVQAIIDSDVNPDGPMLSERFWDLIGDMPELRERANHTMIGADHMWQERVDG